MTVTLTALDTTNDGALLTLADAKDYLRITGTDEDDVIGGLIEAAEAFMASEVGRIITAASVTESVSVGRNTRGFGVRDWPMDSTVTPVVLDPDGSDVVTMFDIDYATGRFRAPYTLTPGTYTVTYTGGISLSDAWARYQPMLAGAVRDWVAELYANRDPGASSVTDGDMSRSTYPLAVPPRVMRVITLLRGW
ncbi:MAG: head-tail connector protein [Patescibacteria group bacterium]|jgi:uncharacterized phiE125 gp8 family phage protein